MARSSQYANPRVCVSVHATRPHTHTLALASIHKTMALSDYELIATFEYVYSHKGSDHSEKLARKTGLARVNERREYFRRHRRVRVVGLHDLSRLIDARLNSRFISIYIKTSSGDSQS